MCIRDRSLYVLSARSLIDLNRAGMPLIEIVFEPDLADGYEAAGLLEELMLILKAVDSCSCKIGGIFKVKIE